MAENSSRVAALSNGALLYTSVVCVPFPIFCDKTFKESRLLIYALINTTVVKYWCFYKKGGTFFLLGSPRLNTQPWEDCPENISFHFISKRFIKPSKQSSGLWMARRSAKTPTHLPRHKQKALHHFLHAGTSSIHKHSIKVSLLVLVSVMIKGTGSIP